MSGVIWRVEGVWSGEGCGVLIIMHGRSGMTIGPRLPTMPGRSTSGFHRSGRLRGGWSGASVGVGVCLECREGRGRVGGEGVGMREGVEFEFVEGGRVEWGGGWREHRRGSQIRPSTI